jgi:hypothetical protein
MPLERSSRAPHFSGNEDKLLSEFLREYENLANSCRLTSEEKVDTIMRYVPRSMKHLWETRHGYQVGDWDDFKAELEDLHPDVTAPSRHTKQGLETLRRLSAKFRIHSESEVLKYYRNFVTVADPLLMNQDITMSEYNATFFRGFHPSIQTIIVQRFKQVYPHHLVHEPFPVPDVLDAARHFRRPKFCTY